MIPFCGNRELLVSFTDSLQDKVACLCQWLPWLCFVLLFLFWKHSSMKVWSRWSWVKFSTYRLAALPLFVMWLSWQGDRIILSCTFRKWLFNWLFLLTLFCFGCFLPNRLVSAIPIPHEEGFPNLSLGLNSEKHDNLAFSVLVPPLGLEDLKYLTWVFFGTFCFGLLTGGL